MSHGAPAPPPSPWPSLLAAILFALVATALVLYWRGGC
jgi:hypothetical protein